MSFTSIEFAVFLPIVATLYFGAPAAWRWAVLLAASIYFYASWIPIYTLLLAYSILVSYAAGLLIPPGAPRRRLILGAAIALCAAPLFFCKYFTFLNHEIARVLHRDPTEALFGNLEILLPIGISFYTFQAIGYLIDVYRGVCTPERSLWTYALFKAFFPQLVAGPIERSTHLLVEVRNLRRDGSSAAFRFSEDRVVSGLRLMLYGYLKKLVIADNLAIIVNEVYAAPADYGGLMLLFATYCFAYQIYCDFSAYSDIARGLGRIFGIELMLNFDRPYHARSIRQFWQRWHISLTTWFRDYVYYPMGGNRVKAARWMANIVAVFILSGIWHGANWTFVIWGAIHGVAYLASLAVAAPWGRLVRRCRLDRLGLAAALEWFATFHVVILAWVFFRAASLGDALLIVKRILRDVPKYAWRALLHPARTFANATPATFALTPEQIGMIWNGGVLLMLAAVLVMESFDALRARPARPLVFAALPAPARWAAYYALGVVIWIGSPLGSYHFIYFQF